MCELKWRLHCGQSLLALSKVDPLLLSCTLSYLTKNKWKRVKWAFCVYKNCSECQKQFLYTTCSPRYWAWNFHVLNLQFNEQSVVILWVTWCKNKSRASDKDLPVIINFVFAEYILLIMLGHFGRKMLVYNFNSILVYWRGWPIFLIWAPKILRKRIWLTKYVL